MKKIIMLLLIIMSFLVTDVQAIEKDVSLTTQAFFNELKSGQNMDIINMLTGSYLNEKGELLKSDTYRSYLSKIYKNASMVINSITAINQDEQMVDVEIYFENQTTPLRTKFVLQRINGIWKISDEITDIEGAKR